jgi:hypothetical protein
MHPPGLDITDGGFLSKNLVGKFRVKFQQPQHPTFEIARQDRLILWDAVDVNRESSP